MSLEEATALLVGVLGTAIAIYQFAIINANKKRLAEVQFLLAGIHRAAIQSHLSWTNQLILLSKSEDPKEKEIIQICVRARDDCMALAALASTLEGAIDTGTSAIDTIAKQLLEQTKLTNLIQEEVRKNPALPK